MLAALASAPKGAVLSPEALVACAWPGENAILGSEAMIERVPGGYRLSPRARIVTE